MLCSSDLVNVLSSPTVRVNSSPSSVFIYIEPGSSLTANPVRGLVPPSTISFAFTTNFAYTTTLKCFNMSKATFMIEIQMTCCIVYYIFMLQTTLLAKKVVTPRDDVSFLWLFLFNQSARSKDRLFGVIWCFQSIWCPIFLFCCVLSVLTTFDDEMSDWLNVHT